MQVEHRTGKVRRPKTDVLPGPLCYAANSQHHSEAVVLELVSAQCFPVLLYELEQYGLYSVGGQYCTFNHPKMQSDFAVD